MVTLVISLPHSMPSAGLLLECVQVEAGAVPRQEQRSLGLLGGKSAGEQVLVVPAERLSWQRVVMPKGTLDKPLFAEGQSQRTRAILSGLLEDALLDEPDKLHMALQPQARAHEPAWVAVCDRAWLLAWLNELEQAGLAVSRIVPEHCPSNTPDTRQIRVRGSAEQAMITWVDEGGVLTLPVSAASVAAVLQQAGDLAQLSLFAEPAVVGLAEQSFKSAAQVQTRAQAWANALTTDWDLAQFDLLRTRGARTRKNLRGVMSELGRSAAWRPARWAVFLLFGVNLAGLQAWAWKEQAALDARRSAIRSTLTHTFPDVQVVVDAPAQMARSLQNLQRSSGQLSDTDLETMLGQVHKIATPASAPGALNYQPGQLRLKGFVMQGGTDAPLDASLRDQGWSIKREGDTLVLTSGGRP